MNKTIDWLVANGWREYPNQFKEYARCFYKRFETPTRCHCNDGKSGMQIELSMTKEYESYEIELCGKLKDGTWIKLQNYALPQNIDEVLTLIPRLLRIWEAAQ